MMGERQSGQDALFYEFSLERHVPAEHLLRSIDRFVELDGVRCELAPFYSEMGRPSIESGAADFGSADRRLLLRYSLGAAAMRGSSPEPGVSLVLPAWA